MDNIWIHAKGDLWDPIIDKFKKDGYWGKVIMRTSKPSIDEYRKIKSSFKLPVHMRKAHEDFYETLIQNNYYLLDKLFRKTDWKTDSYNSSSFHELSWRIRIYYEFYKMCLLKKKINLVIFMNTPHMGWDNILYETAKHCQIKTLILDQSKFPNKFFHFFNFDDYGVFETSKILGNLKSYEVEKKVEKDWFYMKKNQGKISTLSLKKLLTLSKYQKRIHNIIEGNDYLRLLKELSIRRYRPQAFFRFYTERNYKKNLKQLSTARYSLTNEFIYFPLHTQPERATSIWGGIYLDQVLALERLAQIIPNEWFIYVKEAPKQKGAYRDRLFFERIKLIPNLLYLSKQSNTFELIKHSQFVATIVGTVGWEAISCGKNVLCFGWGRWYKTLPGVYEYQNNIIAHDLVKKSIDHDLLQKKTADLINKCGTGIIYDTYIPSIPNFSMGENTKTVVESLKRILYS